MKSDNAEYEQYYPNGINKILKDISSNNNDFEKYEQFNHSHILTIEKTDTNYFILLKNGNLLSIFDNNTATLGRDITNKSDNEKLIGKVQINEKIIDVRCGSRHVLALTVSGKVYSWGPGNSPQVIFIISIKKSYLAWIWKRFRK